MMSTGSSRTPRNLSTGNTDAIAVSILGEAAAAITMKFVKKDAEFFTFIRHLNYFCGWVTKKDGRYFDCGFPSKNIVSYHVIIYAET